MQNHTLLLSYSCMGRLNRVLVLPCQAYPRIYEATCRASEVLQKMCKGGPRTLDMGNLASRTTAGNATDCLKPYSPNTSPSMPRPPPPFQFRASSHTLRQLQLSCSESPLALSASHAVPSGDSVLGCLCVLKGLWLRHACQASDAPHLQPADNAQS